MPWRDLVPGVGRAPGASVGVVTRLVCAATGAAPVVVDLADEGVAVVKVLCPDPARRTRA